MNYTDNFKSYVNKCIELNHYVGIGKPYSNILIIGKEAYIDDNQKHADNDNLQNAQKWAKRIENQEAGSLCVEFACSPCVQRHVENIQLDILNCP